MTEKAQAVLKEMSKQQAMKRLANPERRNRILDQFNRENLDDVGPVGGEQRMKVLSEMNSLVDDHREFVKSMGPTLVVV
jgi:hypothetical protein